MRTIKITDTVFYVGLLGMNNVLLININLKARDFGDFLENIFSQKIKLTTYFSDMWNYVKCDIS